MKNIKTAPTLSVLALSLSIALSAPTEGVTVIGADAVLEIRLERTDVPTPAVPASKLFVGNADAVLTQETTPPAFAAFILPDLQLSGSALDFGTVEIGEAKSLTLTVTNTGRAVLSVTGLTLSDTLFSVSPASLSVPPGESRDLVVRFAPAFAGDHKATLLVGHNAANSPAIVALSGTGKSQQPPSLPLGLAAVPGPNRALLSWRPNPEDDLAHYVVYRGQTPSALGDSIGTASRQDTTFADSALDRGVHYYSVRAVNVAGLASEASERVSVVIAPRFSISGSTVSFGDVGVRTSKTQELTITNSGTSALIIHSLSIAGPDTSPFRVSPDTLRIEPEQRRTVTVIFAPTDTGDKTAVLRIAHDAEESPAEVPLSGKGVAPVIRFSAQSLAMDTVNVGTSISQTVAIANQGAVVLSLSDISVTGVDSSSFGAPAAQIDIPPGESHELAVTFTPVSSGPKRAALVIKHNASEEPARIELSGVGIALSVAVSLNEASAGAKAGEDVLIDIKALSGAEGVIGLQLILRYDQRLVRFTEAEGRDLMSNSIAIAHPPANGRVEINVAILGGVIVRNAGELVRVKFRMLEDIGDKTEIVLHSGTIGTSAGQYPLELEPNNTRVVIEGVTAPTPDFNRDGVVDFSDFLLFAQHFGRKRGDAGFDAKFDLDGDGSVGFGDFLIFAQSFGRPAP